MLRALFRSFNLIGDALNISPALNAWYGLHQDCDIDLLTLPDHIAPLYERMGVPLRLFTNEGDLPLVEAERHIREVQEAWKKGEFGLAGSDEAARAAVLKAGAADFEFNFDCSKSFTVGHQHQCHQTEAYARMLGVEISSMKPIYNAEPCDVAELPEKVIFLSLFSRSCSSQEGKPPNKMLPWPKWKPLLRYIRQLGYPIRVLGAAADRADELSFSEEEYWTGRPLNTVAYAMRQRAVLLVGIDNGMAHLAGSQELPTFLLYPQCLSLRWIAPWGNPYMTPVQMDPVTASPAALLWAMRAAVPGLLGVRAQLGA